MGRGAEASALVVMSICSGVDSSMAWSWGDWRTPGPPLGTRGLRCQQCPPENLTGLKAQRRNRWMMKNGRLIIFCILTAEKGQNSDSDKNFKWFYQLNWRNIVMENKKKRLLIATPCTQWSIETDVSLLSEGESQECGVEQMRWRTSLSLLRHPALHWFKYADWYKIQHLAAHTERSELPQKPERSEKKYLYPGESAGFQHRLLSKCGVIFI